jgi:hypothetical protein
MLSGLTPPLLLALMSPVLLLFIGIRVRCSPLTHTLGHLFRVSLCILPLPLPIEHLLAFLTAEPCQVWPIQPRREGPHEPVPA